MDRCGREPTPTNVKKWIVGIGAELGIHLKYTELVHSALTCRYRKYAATLKSKKGGAGRDAYRSLMWDVPITTADLCDDENIQLQKEVATLKHQIEDLEKAAKCTPNANKRKPLSECYQSQIRKRKKKFVEDFSLSISWMPKEIGLVPLSLQAFNLHTSKREEVQLSIPDEVQMEDVDVLSRTLMMKDKHMISGLCLHIYCIYISIYMHMNVSLLLVQVTRIRGLLPPLRTCHPHIW